MTGVCPQGYLLAWDDLLFVPTGRNVPAAYDRRSGKLLYYRSQPSTWGNRWGGTWAFLADGLLFNWRCHVGPDIDVQIGEYKPHKDDGIVCFEARTGKERREFPGKLDAVAHDGTLYASGGGSISAYDLKAWLSGEKKPKWETPHDRCYALILAGDTLYAGGKNTVTALSAADGKVLWRDKVEGQARALAVANGRLLVSTTAGRLVCYGPQPVADPPIVSFRSQSPDWLADDDDGVAELAQRILDEAGKREGLALVLGADDGRLVYQLARASKLTIYCLEPSADCPIPTSSPTSSSSVPPRRGNSAAAPPRNSIASCGLAEGWPGSPPRDGPASRCGPWAAWSSAWPLSAPRGQCRPTPWPDGSAEVECQPTKSSPTRTPF